MKFINRCLANMSRRAVVVVRLAAVVIVAAGVLLAVTGQRATASTLNGTATIATPGTLTPLTSGGSKTLFTVTLPAAAACTGDTASGGYHVFSYLVPAGTAVTSLNFSTQQPTAGFGLVDSIGTYFGPKNTAITTGQIVGIPQDLEWAPVVTPDAAYTAAQLTASASNPWSTGLVCANSSGAVTDYWNAGVTFLASTSDPTAFTWTATTPDPGNQSTTTTTTATTTGSSTTTTTASSGSSSTTSTTTASPSSASGTGGTGSGTGAGSSSGASTFGSSSPSSSSGSATLAYTGFPTTKGVGLGLLAVGLGLILIGWTPRRIRLAEAAGRGGRRR